MKRTITRSFLLLALASLLFASCKKDYDVPPIQDLPVGKYDDLYMKDQDFAADPKDVSRSVK